MQREDFEPLLLFCELMHQESPAYRDQVVDRDKLLKLGEAIVMSPDRYCGLVALQEGKLQGMMAGYLTEPYFGPGVIASDLALFVASNARGGRAAIALIERFEAWAVEHGAESVQLGITTGVNQERTGELYQRLGFAPFGLVYRKSTRGGI